MLILLRRAEARIHDSQTMCDKFLFIVLIIIYLEKFYKDVSSSMREKIWRLVRNGQLDLVSEGWV